MKVTIGNLVLLLLAIVFISFDSYAQLYNYGRNSDFSIEIGGGLPIAISPTNDSKFGDNNKLEFGLRYLPERSDFGVRGYYTFASLSESGAETNGEDKKLKMNRIEFQVLYMLNDLLGISNRSNFELESYVGLGAALGKPTGSSVTNKMIATTIGLRPRVLIDNNRLHAYLDTSYGILINQLFDYSGRSIPNTGSNSGSMLHLSLGLSYRL